VTEYLILATIALIQVFYIWWAYIHFDFWRTFKREAPEEYNKHKDWSLYKYTGSFAWIDYALARRYKALQNENVTRAGEALCRAYLGVTSLKAVRTFLMGPLVLLFIFLAVTRNAT
jgi:hypothetical protein